DADGLAADLRRHLTDLPLRGVANRSWTERWHKWRHRRPQAFAWVGMVLTILATALIAGMAVRTQIAGRLGQAEAALADGRQHGQNRAYPQAIQRWTQGLALARGTSGGGQLTRELEDQLRWARRAQAAQILHTVADRIRFLFDPESLSPHELQSLET